MHLCVLVHVCEFMHSSVNVAVYQHEAYMDVKVLIYAYVHLHLNKCGCFYVCVCASKLFFYVRVGTSIYKSK